jgi:hypothetical protein
MGGGAGAARPGRVSGPFGRGIGSGAPGVARLKPIPAVEPTRIFQTCHAGCAGTLVRG